MSAIALKNAAFRLLTWIAAQLGAPAPSPLPLSTVRSQIESLLHSRQAAALIGAIALVAMVHGIRSAWVTNFNRGYPR
jgi:hypothetical protein